MQGEEREPCSLPTPCKILNTPPTCTHFAHPLRGQGRDQSLGEEQQGFGVTGTGGLQGYSAVLHPEGVEAAEAQAEEPVQRSDAGELQEFGLPG